MLLRDYIHNVKAVVVPVPHAQQHPIQVVSPVALLTISLHLMELILHNVSLLMLIMHKQELVSLG